MTSAREQPGRVLLATGCVLLAAGLLLLVPGIAAADVPTNGMMIGASMSALAQTFGPPANVTSGDSGNRFVFAGGTTAYADDDGVVLAVDLQSGSPRIDIDGTVRAFPIGEYSVARADAELAEVAEFATPTRRSYRLAPRRDLVLNFAQSSQRLERVTYGEPGQLARLGLLPGDAAAKAVVYSAPHVGRSAIVVQASGPLVTVYRITIDRAGAVTSVNVAIPSARPPSDAEFGRHLGDERYAPATLDGRPIAATIFVELRH